MSAKFNQCFTLLISQNEGKYANDQNDPGGETMWGVTKEVARENGYDGPMQEMPLSVAYSIYKRLYWASWMENASMPLAFELFDCAVNCGKVTAAKLFQRSLGVREDGIIGPKTMAAATAASTCELWVKYAATVLEYKSSLTGWKYYAKGWVNRAIGNLRRGVEML